LLWAIQTEIYDSDLIKTKSYFYSNPHHPSKIEWPMLLPYSVDKNRGGGRVAPWAVVRSSGLVHSALIFGPILPT
jgi:hypothetical protein